VRRHLRRWGAAWFVALWFTGSWVGQYLAMRGEIAEAGAEAFWASTFENWQSEALQLLLQGVGFLALKHHVFKADAEDQERMEGKIDVLIERSDPEKKGTS
jgi:hypothetical protein